MRTELQKRLLRVASAVEKLAGLSGSEKLVSQLSEIEHFNTRLMQEAKKGNLKQMGALARQQVVLLQELDQYLKKSIS